MNNYTFENTTISQENFKKILCPNLRIGVLEGLLKPDAKGWVTDKELKDFLNYIGITKSSRIERRLIALAKKVVRKKRENKVSLIDYKDSKFDHGSGSGIINNPQGFSEERLQLLKSYANKKGNFYLEDFTPAVNHFHQCPFHKKSTFGTNLSSFEFASILGIYGQTDEQGKKFFSTEDVDDFVIPI